jgi:hypothetical protein
MKSLWLRRGKRETANCETKDQGSGSTRTKNVISKLSAGFERESSGSSPPSHSFRDVATTIKTAVIPDHRSG